MYSYFVLSVFWSYLGICYFSLHRAIYKEAAVYILDDPLSAVDAHVGRHLFEDCICDFLQHKTRLLVTHQLQYLQSVDNILILNNVSAFMFKKSKNCYKTWNVSVNHESSRNTTHSLMERMCFEYQYSLAAKSPLFLITVFFKFL